LENNAARGQYVEERNLTLTPEIGDPQYCAWSADSSLIVVSHEDENALVLNGSTLNLVNQFAFVRHSRIIPNDTRAKAILIIIVEFIGCSYESQFESGRVVQS
jgi:hypothetical protein